MRSCEPEFVRSRICWVGPPHLRRDLIHFADHHPQGSTSGGKGIFRILILTEGTSRKPLDDGRKHQARAYCTGLSLTLQERVRVVRSTRIARLGQFADCRHFLKIARQLGECGLRVKVNVLASCRHSLACWRHSLAVSMSRRPSGQYDRPLCQAGGGAGSLVSRKGPLARYEHSGAQSSTSASSGCSVPNALARTKSRQPPALPKPSLGASSAQADPRQRPHVASATGRAAESCGPGPCP